MQLKVCIDYKLHVCAKAKTMQSGVVAKDGFNGVAFDRIKSKHSELFFWIQAILSLN